MTFNTLRTKALTILHNVAMTIDQYPQRGKYNKVVGGYTTAQKDVMNTAISAVKNINVISMALYQKDVITFKEDTVELPAFEVADEEEA